jgi:hypothetical protein
MSIIYRININQVADWFLSDPGVPGGYVAQITRQDPIPTFYDDWAIGNDSSLRVLIGSVSIDALGLRTVCDKKTSYADYTTDPGSFFWDNNTQSIYINFSIPLSQITAILIGVSTGYTTSDLEYLSEVEHRPYIKPNFTIEKSVDPLTVGKMAFIQQDIEFINTGGEQDFFIPRPVPGNIGTILYKNDDTDAETEIYSGYVTGDKTTLQSYSQSLQDLREKEQVSIPNTFFDSTTYPNIDESLIDELIPEGYGRRRQVKCFPLNTNTTGDVSFKFATDATTIHSVEIKDSDDAWQSVTPATTDASNGEFTIASSTARNGDAVFECRADVTLRDIANPGDIIKDMLDRYLGVNYDATGFNQAEWTTEGAKLSDVSMYMGDERNFFEWVELLQTGSDKNFIYDILGDGKRTLRVDDPDREPRFRIKELDIIDDGKEVTRDFSQYASKVVVKYDKSDTEDKFLRVSNTTFEDTALENYGVRKTYEIESLLVSSSDADTKAAILAEDQSAVRAIYTTTIKIKQDEVFDLKLYDIGLLNFTDGSRDYWGQKMVKIIGLSIDPDVLEIKLTLRETIGQTIPTESMFLLDTNGNQLYDSNNDPLYDTSGVVWEVG